MRKLRCAVLVGGWSAERSISLISGWNVAEGFRRMGWPCKALDLWPDGAGRLEAGPAGKAGWAGKTRLSELVSALRKFRAEFVFLCLHGTGGEDGCVQGLLELAGIPYSGSGVMASSLAMDKAASKRIFQAEGLPTPAWKSLVPGQKAKTPSLPCVVKPASQGSAVGVTLVRRKQELGPALEAAWKFGGPALAEGYIAGRELTVGVLGGQALPAVEIKPKHEFYDWASKYDKGGSVHLCPAPLDKKSAGRAAALGLAAHQALGCRAFSRVDMMMDPRGKLWLLEVNTLPGMTQVSLLPDAARAAGFSFGRLLEKMVAFSLP